MKKSLTFILVGGLLCLMSLLFLISVQTVNSTASLAVVAVMPRYFPPQYSLNEQGKPVGFAIDVMDEIARRANLQVTYQIAANWEEANIALTTGKADLIPNSGITPERQKKFSYTSPVETFPISLFVRRHNRTIRGIEDLDNHKVGITKTNIAKHLLQNRPKIKLCSFDTIENAIFELLSGRIDALIYPEPVVLKIAEEAGIQNRIKVVGEPLIEVKRAIAVRKDNLTLLARLNPVVDRFVTTEDYQRIYRKWYGKPLSFWSNERLFGIMSSILLLTILSFLAWRFYSLRSLNRLKQTEAALRKSESRYRAIVEDQPELICRFRPDNTLTFVNNSYCRYFSKSREELVGNTFIPLIPDEDKIQVAQNIALLSQEVPLVTHEHRIIDQSGRVRWQQWTNRAIFDEQGQLIEYQAVGRDITELKNAAETIRQLNAKLEGRVQQRTAQLEQEIAERKASEEKLRQQQELLQTIVDHIPVMLTFLDDKNQLLWVNREWENVLGWTLKEVQHRDIFNKFYPDPVYRQQLYNFIQTADKAWGDFQTHVRDGRILDTSWTNVRLSNGSLIGIGQDITKRKQFEAALQESEAKYKLLFESNPHPLWVFDVETLAFLEVNEAAIRHYGYSRNEFLSMTLHDIRPTQDIPILEQTLDKMDSKKTNFGIWRHKKRNGEIIEVEIISHALVFEGRAARLVLAHDVTARNQAERALRESEERFRRAIVNAPLPIIIHSEDGQIVQINQAWTDLTGYTHEEIPTIADWTEKAYGERKETVRSVMEQLYQIDDRVEEGEFIIINSKNECRIWNFSSAPLGQTPDGKRLVISMALDVTERKAAEERLRHDALHDALTGLPNRVLLMEQVEQSILRNKRHKNYIFAVLFVDLDRFKMVNDSLGHFVGDQLLVVIAYKLQHCVRASDIVARLGGDEFIILLDDLNTKTEAIRVAKRICDELNAPFIVEGQEFFVSASIGVAFNSSNNLSGSDILRNADLAMYQAKENGKARYAIFDPSMHIKITRLLEIETNLRQAIERQEFLVHYQPIFFLETGQLVGFEALVRWVHPEQGLISPSEFIPVAEETGLIIPLGKWILLEACRQMKIWQEKYLNFGLLYLSVNLSLKQFQQPDLIHQIDTILTETGLEGSYLKLEITESMLMQNTDAVVNMLLELKNKNIQISIDDFGTGYSSLSYLHRLPVDTLKIDRSFVSQMNEGGENLEIVEAIITLAHHLGVTVIAEGIETEQNLIRLKDLKCEFGQGYLFSKPLDKNAAEEYIKIKRTK